ncbi:DUF3397 family protein [Streptococcus suis]|nr:DUF3397 family protein [Streptococcus suis]
MLFLKIAAVLFVVLTLTISIIFVKIFGLQKRGGNFADLAFPMFAFEFYLISDKMYYNSLLPHLILSLSLLSLGLCIFFLIKKKSFSYKRFFKIFWRSGFILTFFMYLALVIAVLTLKS